MPPACGERSGDPTPHIPPTAAAVVNANKVLTDFVAGVAGVRAGLPTWLAGLVPNLSPLAKGYEYWHWGPQIMTLDYISPAGVAVRRTLDQGNELQCAASDLDRFVCAPRVCRLCAAPAPHAWGAVRARTPGQASCRRSGAPAEPRRSQHPTVHALPVPAPPTPPAPASPRL